MTLACLLGALAAYADMSDRRSPGATINNLVCVMAAAAVELASLELGDTDG